MTFFEQELRRLFEHDMVFSDARFVGNACYGRLTDNIRVKINFVTCWAMDNYDALKVTLLNRNEGQIDSMTLRFRDLWGMKKVNNPNFRDGVSPYIWKHDGRAEWYVYRPDRADYNQLVEAVNAYVGVFQEPELQQSPDRRLDKAWDKRWLALWREGINVYMGLCCRHWAVPGYIPAGGNLGWKPEQEPM